MSSRDNIESPDFWSHRYASKDTPWVVHRIPSALQSFLIRTKPGSVLIPGCGTAHEVIRAFCTAGFAVRAIDFSPIAVQETKTALGPLADNVLLGDFFQYDFDRTRFDIVYERTFLCALSPERWKEYGARVAELLRPGGRLAGIFFYGEEDDPPPYPLNDQRAREVFAEHFRLDRSDAVTDSLPVFAGNERWQEWISVAD